MRLFENNKYVTDGWFEIDHDGDATFFDMDGNPVAAIAHVKIGYITKNVSVLYGFEHNVADGDYKFVDWIVRS